MEVILKQDAQPLGFKDDIVSVKNGYGRNFLIPQGVAILATESARKMHAETIKQRAKKDAKLQAEAEAISVKLAALTLKVGAKAGESGKIFAMIHSGWSTGKSTAAHLRSSTLRMVSIHHVPSKLLPLHVI